MTNRNFTIRALGEIAIRCNNKPAMVAFYENIIGLERLSGDDDAPITFFKIAEGFEGHTSILALFRYDIQGAAVSSIASKPPETGATSSLHHIALTLPFAEQDAVMAWYDTQHQPYHIQHFDWIGWRGVFTDDPDGNTVELVAKDPDWRG